MTDMKREYEKHSNYIISKYHVLKAIGQLVDIIYTLEVEPPFFRLV